MKKPKSLVPALATISIALFAGCAAHTETHRPKLDSTAARISYPTAKQGEVVDDFHGTKVADPYRWLEEDSDDTHAFVEAQNKLTRSFVDGPTRETVKTQLTELLNYVRYTAPRKEGEYYFFNKNDGLQNQSVLYVTKGLKGEARVLIDPNTLAKDGTVALSGTNFTRDGELMAYGVASAGSDQKDIHIRRVNDGTDLPDVLNYCKFANIAWKQDKSGFWYNRYPTPGTVAKEDQARFNKLYWHKLGTKQEADPMLFAPSDKELSASGFCSDDGEYLLMELSRGTSPNDRLYFRRADDSATKDGQFAKLFDDEDASYSFIEHDGPVFYILTNKDAPNRKLIAVNTASPNSGSDHAQWKTLIPESSDVISSLDCVNNQFIVTYLHDAHDIVKFYDMAGKHLRDLELPGIGSVGGLAGHRSDHEAFYTYSSFVSPPTIYRYDFGANKAELFRKAEVKFDPDKYETKQIFAKSKDGTKVPMFITHRRGLKMDGNNPTMLTGYGGFDVNTTPYFSTTTIPWLDNGGVMCEAVLRGGGEYGEDWHRAGMLEKKQNVFDDFICCAQYLIDHKYTSTKKLAIEGGSNGGLLVAACEVQRPDLYGAVLCHVPLTDMLRFHRFSVGRFWTVEYGDAEKSAEQFAYIRKYSPLQNVKPGTVYPPTMIFTGDHDDRVVPLHARKFAAALQAADAGNNPILLRVETRAGHGGGKPITKQIDETADQYAFLVKVFGMSWK